jgi:hypothetical protein
MKDLSGVETGQIVDARLAEASVTRTATSLGLPRASVSKVPAAYRYRNRGKASAQRNSGAGGGNSKLERERFSCIEKDCFENHKTTAAQATEEL